MGGILKMSFTTLHFFLFLAIGVLTILMLYFNVRINSSLIYIVVPLMVMCVLTFGMGTILLHFGVFVEDLSNVVNIVLRAVFYMTGIFYSVESRIPSPYSGVILKCNPMAFILSSLRKCLLYGETPSRKLLVFWIFIGLAISVIGVRTIYKNENSYVKVI